MILYKATFHESVSGDRVDNAESRRSEFLPSIPSGNYYHNIPNIGKLHEMQKATSSGRLSVIVAVLESNSIFGFDSMSGDVVRSFCNLLVCVQ